MDQALALSKNRERARLYRLANPDRVRATRKQYRLANKDKLRVVNKEYYLKNAEYLIQKQSKYTAANKEVVYRRRLLYRLTLREYVIEAYGGACACCGENNSRLLTVDHIDNDGSKDRSAGLRGPALYKKLRAAGFPKNLYRLLCWNCNVGRYHNEGECPHKTLNEIHATDAFSKVLLAYGEKCSCCGEGRHAFLTVDHVNNDGATHRKSVGGGEELYKWLARKGFPQDAFRLLCFNCNSGRATNRGVCPHISIWDAKTSTWIEGA